LATGNLLLINTPDPKRRCTMHAYLAADEDGICNAKGGPLLDVLAESEIPRSCR